LFFLAETRFSWNFYTDIFLIKFYFVFIYLYRIEIFCNIHQVCFQVFIILKLIQILCQFYTSNFIHVAFNFNLHIFIFYLIIVKQCYHVIAFYATYIFTTKTPWTWKIYELLFTKKKISCGKVSRFHQLERKPH